MIHGILDEFVMQVVNPNGIPWSQSSAKLRSAHNISRQACYPSFAGVMKIACMVEAWYPYFVGIMNVASMVETERRLNLQCQNSVHFGVNPLVVSSYFVSW